MKATKTIVPKVPRKQIWRVNNTLIMHPEMANKLKRQISNIKDYRKDDLKMEELAEAIAIVEPLAKFIGLDQEEIQWITKLQ